MTHTHGELFPKEDLGHADDSEDFEFEHEVSARLRLQWSSARFYSSRTTRVGWSSLVVDRRRPSKDGTGQT